MSESVLLEARGLKKMFRMGKGGGVSVLEGTDLCVAAGETVSIRGMSGSGKTTLLNLMGGLDRPQEGEVFWQGENIGTMSASRLASWRNASVGFIFQSFHLMPELDVLENVELPAWLARRDARGRALELLEAVGLSARLHHRPGELSGGEQQRVAIARALVNDPPLLLADEPTGNLDEQTGGGVVKLLLDLVAQKKKALVLVTHDSRIASGMTTRYELVQGTLKKTA